MNEGANDEKGLFPSTVGEQLAAERARQKLELADIAARTRIPLRHLDAIEKGKHDGLPALPYSAGFVKSYGTMLGLDGNALSRAFRVQMGDAHRAHFEPEAYEPVDPSRVPSRLLAMIALGVALLLGMVYLLLRFEGDNSDLAKLAADTVQDIRPAVARPAAPPPPRVVEPVAPTGPISIVASDDIWIKVTDNASGGVLFKDVLKAGQSYVVPDTAVEPSLRVLMPQLVRVKIGETELPPVGASDTLVPAYSLKRDDVVAMAMAMANARPAGDAPDMAGDGVAGLPGSIVQPMPGVEPPRGRPGDQTPRVQDPATSRMESSQPARDSGQRPQP